MTRIHIFVLSVCALLFSACATTTGAIDRPELFQLTENRAATHRVDILPAGHGSGTVLSLDGHILTCAHVVADEPLIRIRVGEGETARNLFAYVVAIDRINDLAVIKVEHRFDRPVTLADPSELHPGDALYNVGYPYDFGEIVGRGYIMKLHHDDDDFPTPLRDVTLVDLPDGPGTSGSGVFLERNGRLMGVMRMSVWISSRRAPPMVVRALVSIETVRSFLDANRIPYLTREGPRVHPPIPPSPAPRPATEGSGPSPAPAAP